MKIKKVLLVLLAVALLAGFALVVLRSGPLAPIRVTVAEVAEADLAPTLFGIGTVEARRSYQIGPTVAGRVLNVAVDVGDSVKAGQLLAEMDPIDLDQRVGASSAAAERASSAILAAEAQWQDARTRRELAAANAKRYIELGEKAFVSASVVEGKLQEEKSAAAQLSAAEASLTGARQDRDRLRAEHAGLLQQRAKIRLLAPADGVITARDAEPGSTLVAGQSAIRMAVPDSLWIKLRLDQGRSSGLRAGLPASVVLRSQPGVVWPGKVARVELIADSVAEERTAQVAFDALPEGIAIGEMAEVSLQLPVVRKARAVPGAAIRRQGDAVGVWQLKDGALRFTPVAIGEGGGDGKVQVRDGLVAGDSVVVHSERDLAADSRIKVVSSLAGQGK
ncbi:MAG: efflux RND transporter periplasmic adaptor subunit [Betaproteobacteria bacterium]|nr:efflux RND transporter periplasmic adaptor subunit [Betaproteobacteria bacterium]